MQIFDGKEEEEGKRISKPNAHGWRKILSIFNADDMHHWQKLLIYVHNNQCWIANDVQLFLDKKKIESQ